MKNKPQFGFFSDGEWLFVQKHDLRKGNIQWVGLHEFERSPVHPNLIHYTPLLFRTLEEACDYVVFRRWHGFEPLEHIRIFKHDIP